MTTNRISKPTSAYAVWERSFWLDFLDFGWQEAWSCLFPVAIFITLGVTQYTSQPWLPRYDQILLVCLLVQLVMYLTKLETFDEIKVICLFHVFGLALEIFKTHVGSWSYPEPGFTKVFGVPLYSGFMYASVASYMCQAWRRMKLRLEHWPQSKYSMTMAAAVYVNFFTNHFIPDLRLILIPLVLIVFRKATVYFTNRETERQMPIVLSFFLIGFFVWLAENIATFLKGWVYPTQINHWNIVDSAKISSWFLLVIISLICVAQLKHVKARLKKETDPVEMDSA